MNRGTLFIIAHADWVTDELVYTLYGLTHDEIAIVEGSTK